MLCCICKEKEATVHLTQIAGDKMQKVDLCEECAKTKGVNDPTGFSLADLLLGLGASQEIEQAGGGTDLKCPALRLHPGGFQEGRPAGLPGMLRDLRRSRWRACSRPCTRARGTSAKSRKPCARAATCRTGSRQLQKKLAKAIEAEDFEQAAVLRDEIKQTDGPAQPTPLPPDAHGPPQLSHSSGRERAAQRAA